MAKHTANTGQYIHPQNQMSAQSSVNNNQRIQLLKMNAAATEMSLSASRDRLNTQICSNQQVLNSNMFHG